MKDLNELLLQFDDIQNLPVSEETVGAYIENNLNDSELQVFRDILKDSQQLSDILSESSTPLPSLEIEDIVFDEVIDLDNIPFYNYNEAHDSKIENEDIINLLINMNKNYNGQNPNDEAAAAAYRNFGEQSNGKGHNIDLLIYQGNEGVCAIRSQQIILRDYGIDISLEQLKNYAIEQGWYDPSDGGGTPIGCIGLLLEACGVEARQQPNATIYDLVNELAQGHRVIVGVDANELWADREGDIFAQTKEFFKDVFQQTPNHALIVAGVDVNPNDPKDVKVILTDPGTGDLRIEYSIDDFMDAWEDSGCFMTTTTTPAPYQYDEVHGRMIPSNFAVENFIDTNSLPLQPDILIDYPQLSLAELNADAYYSDGHLDTVCHIDGHDVDYDTFAEAYKAASSNSDLSPLALTGQIGALGQDHFDKEAFMSSLKGLFHHNNSSEDEFKDTDNPKDNINSGSEGDSGSSHITDDGDNDDDSGVDDEPGPFNF